MQERATSVDNHADADHGPTPVDPLQARVDAAAFALLREGRNPTVALVRARMGGGSPNVVAPALQRWRLTFAGQLDANAASALDILPPGVLELVQALWSRALFEAHRVRADARSAADALEQLNAAIGELRGRSARLQEREVALDAELRDLHAQRQRLQEAESALARRAATRPHKKESSPVRRRGARPRPASPKHRKPKTQKRTATPVASRRARPASRASNKRPRHHVSRH